MASDDRLKNEVLAAVALLQAGERATARADLLELWPRLQDDGDPYLISTAAHFIADTEDDPELELEWDLKALAAASVGSEKGDFSPVSESVATFMPSLHLNVADAYRRTGNRDQARLHANAGRLSADVLDDDGYGRMIKAALDRVCDTLTPAEPPGE